MLLDRAHQGPILMASARGGVSIEKVAEEDPKAIIKVLNQLKEFSLNIPEYVRNSSLGAF